jgi:hypothetical protein
MQLLVAKSGKISTLACCVDTESVKRKGLTVNLTADARTVIESIRDDTGIPNTEAMTRILEWFATLDRKFRLAILNRDEETRRELAGDALSKMAGVDGISLKATADMTPDQMKEAIRFLTDRLHDVAVTSQKQAANALKREQKGK